MSQQSLADLAVDTLGRVQRMGDGIGLDQPERHAIRQMKQAAEQVLADALRAAQQIVYASESVREVVTELTTAAQPNGGNDAAIETKEPPCGS